MPVADPREVGSVRDMWPFDTNSFIFMQFFGQTNCQIIGWHPRGLPLSASENIGSSAKRTWHCTFSLLTKKSESLLKLLNSFYSTMFAVMREHIIYRLIRLEQVKQKKKRMHSSRMRTARSLTVFPGSLPSFGGGGVTSVGGGWLQAPTPPPRPPSDQTPTPRDHVTYPMMHLMSHLPSPPPPLDRMSDTHLWKHNFHPLR